MVQCQHEKKIVQKNRLDQLNRQAELEFSRRVAAKSQCLVSSLASYRTG